MAIPIVFPSSAAFWLNAHSTINRDQLASEVSDRVSLPSVYDLSISADQKELLSRYFDHYFPVTILSPPDARKYYKNAVFKAVNHPTHMPPKGFIKLRQGIYIASPELCFLQAANKLPFEQLVLLGNDLCGQYVHNDSAEFQQQTRIPITSVQRIRDFLDTAHNCYGYRNAVRATRYILEKSNSPVESKLAFFIRMPAFMGGYALKEPKLNQEISLSEKGTRILRGRSCYGDFVWEKEKVVVEYDSDVSHLSSLQHAKDKHRADAMTISGYRLFSITKNNLASLSAMDETFEMIRAMLGMPSIIPQLEKYIYVRRKMLASFRHFKSYDPGTYHI